MIIEIQNILVSSDILTEHFCCDLTKCKGRCCIEGDAGAPVTLDEVMTIENTLDTIWPDLSASAQTIIDRQGVAYTDQEGDLVTSIVNGKDCVFTCYDNIDIDGETVSNCCLCAIERAQRNGRLSLEGGLKPLSCSLYPIRVKQFRNGTVGLNYHRWDICRDAVSKGREQHIKVYQFLREPLIRAFGQEWYDELCQVAQQICS